MTDLKIADLKDDGNPQIYTLNSAGSGKSYLRIIKQGLRVKQLNAIKYIQPLDIWCIKTLQEDDFDKMIIMSFPTKTIVLTTTANGYSQTKDTGIDELTMSLHVGRLEDNSLVQVFPAGFRHIKTDKTAKTMKF
jgi:splicing factor 3B subunit 3